MDRVGERVKVEEITTVSYGDRRDMFFPWPLSWSAVWVGTLSAVALALVFGLVAIAVGAHRVGQPFGTWREVSFLGLAFSVFGSFLAFALSHTIVRGGTVPRREAGNATHSALAPRRAAEPHPHRVPPGCRTVGP
jgi:hypothetical protein